MTKLSIAIAKTSLLAAVMGAATFAVPAAAQLAAPQWTRPAMDSTHVTGTAERVMPEIASKLDGVMEPL
ncbi:hypothetical protein [Pigmentiphaga litoralis]|uniref:hypothetical protein n=1 Tax=Pigmentiphaga litoralis TaxID=516702 RepID=UPI003B427B74